MYHVTRITPSDMSYQDDAGQPHTIDLKQCSRNWRAWIKAQKRRPSRWDRRCVGRRDISAAPPYFEFFTAPRTVIELESQDIFRDLYNQLYEAGWHTFDLS
ncbi:MAG: hypothetical protein JW910_16950 [Anaerolineae bacterium]|nr:hypothetical protein [Anaerolineae bacterium]